MKWSVRIIVTAALSVAIALSLSWLPVLDFSGGYGSAPGSWAGKRTKQLTDENVVDLMVQLPVQLRIRKVELNHSILSIDLNFPQNADSTLVYRDLYTIAQFVTAKTSNVNQVLVRMMDYAAGSGGGQLVLAMDADREHAKSLDPHPKYASAKALEQLLQERFHMTYTQKWQQRYSL